MELRWINSQPRALLSWLLAAMLLATAGCGHKGGGDEDAKPEGTPVPDVTLTKVQRTQMISSLLVSGNLAALPNRDAKVAALVPGRIARVLVAEGEAVAQGKALAELDSSQLKDQEHQAEAAVAGARANVENARLSAERQEGLLQRGIAARKEVEDARTQLAVNQGALAQAEAALALARSQVGRGVVRAPFAGTVVHRFLGVGEQVDGTAAQPIFEIADISELELLGTVSASRLSELKQGERFSFQTAAAAGEKFSAQVVAVLPAVDPATNNGVVRIRIENRNHLLKLGEYISLELPIQAAHSALVVPRQAVYPDESGEPHVYRVKGDETESVAVKLGAQTKDQTEILSGVNEGDVVILSGGYGLPEKAKVHVK